MRLSSAFGRKKLWRCGTDQQMNPRIRYGSALLPSMLLTTRSCSPCAPKKNTEIPFRRWDSATGKATETIDNIVAASANTKQPLGSGVGGNSIGVHTTCTYSTGNLVRKQRNKKDRLIYSPEYNKSGSRCTEASVGHSLSHIRNPAWVSTYVSYPQLSDFVPL